MNFHQDGRTHIPSKAAKSLLYFESRLKNMGGLELSKESTVFIWQRYGEIMPQGSHPGAGDIAGRSHSSSIPPRLVQKGARGQEGPFRRTRWQYTAFHPVSWEEEKKEVWVGTRPPELLGHHRAAFTRGWMRPQQPWDGIKLSPPPGQNERALSLSEVSSVIR